MKREVLTPDHRYWRALCQRLNDQLFVNINGTPHNKCKGDLTQTIKILRSMHNIDVEETLMLYQECGGYCDCEVLLNVERSWQNG